MPTASLGYLLGFPLGFGIRSLYFAFTGGLLCAAVLYAGRFYKIFIMSAAFGNQVNLIALICTTL